MLMLAFSSMNDWGKNKSPPDWIKVGFRCHSPFVTSDLMFVIFVFFTLMSSSSSPTPSPSSSSSSSAVSLSAVKPSSAACLTDWCLLLGADWFSSASASSSFLFFTIGQPSTLRKGTMGVWVNANSQQKTPLCERPVKQDFLMSSVLHKVKPEKVKTTKIHFGNTF